jgi:hypothetical protein
VANSLTDLIPAPLRDNILKYAFGGAQQATPAPPCKQQEKFPVFGETTQYPHVHANRLVTGKPFSPRR